MSATMKGVEDFFLKMFDCITEEVTFLPEWLDPVATMRPVIHHKHKKIILMPGRMVKAVDRHQRKAIFMGTNLGTLVVSESWAHHGRTAIEYVADELMCEKGMFTRASGFLELHNLQHIFSPEFTQAINEIYQESQLYKIHDNLYRTLKRRRENLQTT